MEGDLHRGIEHLQIARDISGRVPSSTPEHGLVLHDVDHPIGVQQHIETTR